MEVLRKKVGTLTNLFLVYIVAKLRWFWEKNDVVHKHVSVNSPDLWEKGEGKEHVQLYMKLNALCKILFSASHSIFWVPKWLPSSCWFGSYSSILSYLLQKFI